MISDGMEEVLHHPVSSEVSELSKEEAEESSRFISSCSLLSFASLLDFEVEVHDEHPYLKVELLPQKLRIHENLKYSYHHHGRGWSHDHRNRIFRTSRSILERKFECPLGRLLVLDFKPRVLLIERSKLRPRCDLRCDVDPR